MNNKRKIWWPIIIALSLSIGILLGNFFAKRTQPEGFSNSFLKSLFQRSSKVNALLGLIEQQYVDEVNLDSITEDILPKILANLDPHSVYIPASDLQLANEELEGSFSGIGIQFNIQEDTVMIVSVISGGPSEKLGIQPGDRIIAVNDTSFVGKDITTEKVLKKLRGEKGSVVKVNIKRTGAKALLSYKITRGDVPVSSIDAAYIVKPQVGYIKVSKFGTTTYEEFLTALSKLKNKGANSFIIDLRGNSGGYLDAAINMINEFLPKGRLIVYTYGKAYPRSDAYADGTGSCQHAKIAVLIDEWSASASEIFAGAIQDNDRGLIIGRRSFGKGLVQQQIPFSDGSAVRLTIARYFTPSGRSIQKPYKKGDDEAYEMDIVNRYLHGEFDAKDSIQVKDSLQFKTLGGRVVYGGGGVMPDIFVPRDTSGYTAYYNKIVNAGYIYEYAFKYTDNNRSRLKKIKTRQQLLALLQEENLLEPFAEYVSQKGLKNNPYSLAISGKLIEESLQAYIVRNVLGDEAFFETLNQNDKTLKRALLEIGK